MKVYVAEEAGFCFGVKRALDIINSLHEKRHEIQVYGQLIHNRGVLENLKSKGIDCIESFDELNPKKTLIIRTHGIPKEEETLLKRKGIKTIDATCPLVKKLQNTIQRICTDNPDSHVVIVGNKNHPEIIAAKSYCPSALVLYSEQEAQQLESCQHISVVGQTTLDTDSFERIVSILETKAIDINVYNTICSATRVRQEAIKKLAPRVDGVIVVGGKNSSNTKKLYDIAIKRNQNTFYIEKSSQLNDVQLAQKLTSFNSIGITAGASTPPDEITKIENFLMNVSSNIVKEMNHGRRKRNSGNEH